MFAMLLHLLFADCIFVIVYLVSGIKSEKYKELLKLIRLCNRIHGN